jgi:hypothetical protein
LFPPAANSIDSAKEGGESAALDSLDPSRRASISVDGYGTSLLGAMPLAQHFGLLGMRKQLIICYYEDGSFLALALPVLDARLSPTTGC